MHAWVAQTVSPHRELDFAKHLLEAQNCKKKKAFTESCSPVIADDTFNDLNGSGERHAMWCPDLSPHKNGS